MEEQTKTIQEQLNSLPPELQQEVEEFIRTLVQSRKPRKERYMKQDWAGALKEYRNQFTSLELQKKTLEWRGD